MWDALTRVLYVDDAMVAEDTRDGLEGSFDGLYIGCGKNMQAGTYFSGLVDDVRICNRVVAPYNGNFVTRTDKRLTARHTVSLSSAMCRM